MSTTTEPSWIERSRPCRVDALMWIAERAFLLADAYAIRASNGFDDDGTNRGEVVLQGESGSLRSLVERFQAVLAERQSEGYLQWEVVDDGVFVRFIEEAGE